MAIGTATYKDDFEDLPKVPWALRTVVEALRPLGYVTGDGQLGYDVDLFRGELCDKLRLAAKAHQVVIIYYTGHGTAPDRDAYYLVLRNTEAGAFETAVTATEIPRLVTRREGKELLPDQPKVLLILDCCFSGTGAKEIMAQTLRGVGSENLWVLASASELEFAQQGLFAQWFAEALKEPPPLGPSAQWLPINLVADAINRAHPQASQEVHYLPPATGDTVTPPFLPNPVYQEGVAGLTTAEQHWLSRLRGTPDASMTGFYLTGRTGRVQAALDLVTWITRSSGGRGLAVVTGRVGTGKSALLSLPVLLCRPGGRSLIEGASPDLLITRTAEVLPEGTPLVAVHARGLNGDQVARAVAVSLGRKVETVSTLLEDLDAHPQPAVTTVIVDAVDEAARPSALSESLLRPLARRLQIVVGCRTNKRTLVGSADLHIDLDSARYEDPEALTAYVRELLTASRESGISTPYPDDDSTTSVAEEIANRATEATGDGSVTQSFLTAQLMARTIRSRPHRVETADAAWKQLLPTDLGQAFDEDLESLGARASGARPLLEALAWARGPGLPWEGVWAPVAQALADRQATGPEVERPAISDAGVSWLLKNAGAYIVEDLISENKSVFRLFHRTLVTHLRDEPESTLSAPASRAHGHDSAIEQAITAALVGTVPHNPDGRRDWLSAHGYVRTYLAQHAAAAGPDTLAELVADRDFLAIADPVTLTPVLTDPAALAKVPSLASRERIYRRARPLLTPNPGANAAYLEEAASALGLERSIPEDRAIQPWYSTLLASIRHDESKWALTGHTGKVNAVAFGTRATGYLLLAAAGEDGTVRLWNPLTNARYRPKHPFRRHKGSVATVAFGTTKKGTLLVASAGLNYIHVWKPNAVTQIQRIPAHAGWINSVAFGTTRSGRIVLVSAGDDGTVQLWNPLTGKPLHDAFIGHAGPVNGVATCIFHGELMLASAGADGTVRLWNPNTGEELRSQAASHSGAVNALAFLVYDDRLLLAAGGDEGAVHVEDAMTGQQFCDPVSDHHGAVQSLALDASGDGQLRLYVADSHPSGKVHVWLLPSGVPARPALSGHSQVVRSVAATVGYDGRTLLASGSEDSTVRVWDPLEAEPAEPAAPHHTHALSIALGPNRAGGGSRMAFGSDDGSVRLWDGSGEPILLSSRDRGVRTVAFDSDPTRPNVLAASAADGEVELWQPDRKEYIASVSTGAGSLITAVAFGPTVENQVMFALGDDEGRVWLSDLDNGATQELYRHQGGVRTLTFAVNADGHHLLASGGQEGSIRLWDCHTRLPVASPLNNQPLPGVAFCFAAFGSQTLIAAGDDQGFVRVLDPVTGNQLSAPQRGRRGPIDALTLSKTADGHLLVFASSAAWVHVWDATAETPPTSLRRRSNIRALAADGRILALADGEGVCVLALH
ncbi:hypothetical protein ACFYYB_26920 [Streptomyces sp. NPDC002886]|uniref:hypothetical protein n=1 Tax=Streptomyces sp. NPDC002886 TaxID=3364667 RepID=UPI0036B352DF